MISAARVLDLLLRLTPCWADRGEPPQERLQRFTFIATAITDTSNATPRPLDNAAMLIALGYSESRLCKAVHAGTKKGGHGEGLWQLEPGSRRKRPFSGLSLEETVHAAGQATWLIRHSFSCGSTPERRFTQLAFGACRENGWPTQSTRVSNYWWAYYNLEGES